MKSIIRKDTWEVAPRKSIVDHNVIRVTWSTKRKKKSGCYIRKFKAHYCVKGDDQKILSLETIYMYSPVVQ